MPAAEFALTPHDLRDDVNLGVGRDGLEPGILKNFAVDRDRDAVGEVGFQVRVALTEGAQQLADVVGVELELALAARELRQSAGEHYLCHQVLPLPAPFAFASSSAFSTFGGDMGSSVKRMPVAAAIAFAIAAMGGTIGVSPTPRTP